MLSLDGLKHFKGARLIKGVPRESYVDSDSEAIDEDGISLPSKDESGKYCFYIDGSPRHSYSTFIGQEGKLSPRKVWHLAKAAARAPKEGLLTYEPATATGKDEFCTFDFLRIQGEYGISLRLKANLRVFQIKHLLASAMAVGRGPRHRTPLSMALLLQGQDHTLPCLLKASQLRTLAKGTDAASKAVDTVLYFTLKPPRSDQVSENNRERLTLLGTPCASCLQYLERQVLHSAPVKTAGWCVPFQLDTPTHGRQTPGMDWDGSLCTAVGDWEDGVSIAGVSMPDWRQIWQTEDLLARLPSQMDGIAWPDERQTGQTTDMPERPTKQVWQV
jgi:hypothetical protein